MSVRALPNLQGPRVRLRGPLQCDASQLSSLSVDPEIQRGYGVALDAPRQRTREEANGRVQWMMAERCLWVIEHRGAYAGNIELHSHNTQDRRASLALGLADGRLLGQGLGTEAMTCVLGHAFGAPSLGGMDLHRVAIRVAAFSARAIRAYEKCGFVREGVERETLYFEGAWHDDVMMGLLAREFHGRP